MTFTVKIGVILTNTKNEVLLIKEKYHEDTGYKWNFIKGTHDHSDENILECAQREIKEEVGIDISTDNLQLKNIFEYGDATNQRLLMVFHAVNISANAKLASQKDQNSRGESMKSLKWFNEKDLSLLTEKDFTAPYVYLALKDFHQGIEKINIRKI